MQVINSTEPYNITGADGQITFIIPESFRNHEMTVGVEIMVQHFAEYNRLVRTLNTIKDAANNPK